MTDRDDGPWGPDDDELVRQALMSLMDDVATHPLPEPEDVRRRAEGHGDGRIVDLQSRRRRSFTVLAGAAAAVLVAAGAGLFVADQSPETPVGTSSTDATTGTTTSAAPSRLTMLDVPSWEALLGRSVASTSTDAPDGSCFETTEDASWANGSVQVADGAIPAGQWIGTPRSGSGPLDRAVESAIERCADQAVEQRADSSLPGGAGYRAWRVEDPDGSGRWWVEVTDGDELSFLSFAEAAGGTRTTGEIRRVALAVLDEVDLAQDPSPPTSTTSAPTTAKTTTTAPTTASTAPPAPTTTSAPPSSPTASAPPSSPTSSSSTATGTSTDPTPSSSSTTSPPTDLPVVGPVPSRYFVAPSRWASSTLTGDSPTTGGEILREGGLSIGPCVRIDPADPAGGLGIRSGSGDDNYFGRQFVFRDETARERSERHDVVLDGYRTDCGGNGVPTTLGPGKFSVTTGDLTTYVVVTELQSGGTSIIHLTTAKTAPAPLTDATASRELDRLSALAAGR